MLKKFRILLIALVLFIPSIQAKEINHFKGMAGDSIKDNNIYNSSVAMAGNSIDFSSKVNGLAFIAGNDVKIKGNNDYAFIAGNNVNLSGKINKDAFISGENITFDNSFSSDRDLFIFGSDIKISGNISRDINVFGQNVSLENANIKGNIKINADKITIRDKVKIDGKLSYPDESDYHISKNAKIGKQEKIKAEKKTNNGYITTIMGMLSKMLIFIVLTLFIPKLFNALQKKDFNFNTFAENFGKGFLIILLVPLICLLLLITGIGMPLSIILILLYALTIYLSDIITGFVIGNKILKNNTLLAGILGLLILCILKLIPIFGTIIMMFSTLYGIGTIYSIYKTNK